MVRQSYTAVVARAEWWTGEFVTEPHEAAWASEAVFFLRGLAVQGDLAGAAARVQISLSSGASRSPARSPTD